MLFKVKEALFVTLSNNRPSSHHKLKLFSVQPVAIFNSYHYTMHLTPILDWFAFLRAAFNTAALVIYCVSLVLDGKVINLRINPNACIDIAPKH